MVIKSEYKFWKYFSIEAMKNAWSKEDERWDKVYRDKKQNTRPIK